MGLTTDSQIVSNKNETYIIDQSIRMIVSNYDTQSNSTEVVIFRKNFK